MISSSQKAMNLPLPSQNGASSVECYFDGTWLTVLPLDHIG
jgi:hypothetical protein